MGGGEVILRGLASIKESVYCMRFAHLILTHSCQQLERVATSSALICGASDLSACEEYVTCMQLDWNTHPWNSSEGVPFTMVMTSLKETLES